MVGQLVNDNPERSENSHALILRMPGIFNLSHFYNQFSTEDEQ